MMINSQGQHTSLISTASVLVDTLESYGLDCRPIIEEAGFDPDKTYAPATRVSSVKLAKLWELAIHYSGDPCIGLRYADYIQPSTLHGLGFSWLASRSLKEGLERLVRFQRILASDLTLDIREVDNGYRLFDQLRNKDDSLKFPDADTHSQIASIYKICQIMLGPGLKPGRVSFKLKDPGYPQRFEAFFGIPVQFNSGETAIEFDKTTSELPSSSANPELARINDQIVIDYLNRFDKQDVVTQTRKYIIDHLPSGVPKQIVIARDLSLSLRSFQRKLKLSETSYSELLDQVRYEMACSYLKSRQHQVIVIAYMLGYTDPSNFARAFKRWDGLTPNEFRDKENLF